MNRKIMLVASLMVVLSMIVVAAGVATKLHGNVPLPTHWDIHGQPNSFAGKWTALLLPALIAALASAILYILPFIEPRQAHLQRSHGLYLWTWASMLLVSVAVQLAVISAAMHWPIHGTSFVLAGVGAMFAMIGNHFGKSRSMFFIGIRTPWTLASEDVWIQTHRLSGKLLVAGGLMIVAGAFLPLPVGLIITLMVAVAVIAVLVPAGMSYFLWRGEGREAALKP